MASILAIKLALAATVGAVAIEKPDEDNPKFYWWKDKLPGPGNRKKRRAARAARKRKLRA